MGIRPGLIVVSALLATSCLKTTPFDSDPPAEHLIAANLSRLEKSGPAPTPFKMVVIGDTHDAYDELSKAVDSINRIADLNLILILGDLADRGLQQEFNWTWEELNRFKAPWFTVIGNHDALSNGTSIYKKMFGPLDYSFVYGKRKFVMFNSNTLEFPNSAPDRGFLDRELSDLEGAQSLVLATHQRPESPNDLPDGTVKAYYAELVTRHPVELVLNGHLDTWELYTWQGIPSLQAGTFETQFLYTIITLDDSGIALYERCSYDDCEPVTPTPGSSE